MIDAIFLDVKNVKESNVMLSAADRSSIYIPQSPIENNYSSDMVHLYKSNNNLVQFDITQSYCIDKHLDKTSLWLYNYVGKLHVPPKTALIILNSVAQVKGTVLAPTFIQSPYAIDVQLNKSDADDDIFPILKDPTMPSNSIDNLFLLLMYGLIAEAISTKQYDAVLPSPTMILSSQTKVSYRDK